MSPGLQAARERLEAYIEQNPFKDTPRAEVLEKLRRLEDEVISAYACLEHPF